MIRIDVRSLTLAAAASLALALPANAQISFDTGGYTTTGVFSCRPFFLTWKEETGTCTSNGNSVSITSSLGQTLNVFFSGVTAPLISTNSSQAILLGIVSTTLTGPGSFAFPEALFPYDPKNYGWVPFQFALSIYATIDGRMQFVAGPAWASVEPTLLSPDAGARPAVNAFNTPFPGYKLVFSQVATGALTAGTSSTAVTATVGMFAPEPSTFVLTGTGLLGLLVVMRRKRPPNPRIL